MRSSPQSISMQALQTLRSPLNSKGEPSELTRMRFSPHSAWWSPHSCTHCFAARLPQLIATSVAEKHP
jgi:hypothetical protein